MVYRLAVEDIEPRHYVCWVLDLPGCFSPASTQEEAVARAPARIGEYYAWITRHDPTLPEALRPYDVEVVEVFGAHPSAEDPDYVVNAFFEDDARPLAYWDVEVGLRLLDWSRQDLIAVVRSLSREQLHTPIPGEDRETIAGVLEHVCGAENWYLSHLGLAIDRASLPRDVFRKLKAVRANTRRQLVTLVGDQRITERHGERWSARKILRRTLWHERDHTEHIVKLAASVT